MLRKIFGPTNNGQFWQIRYNKELYDLFKQPEIRGIVKTARLWWAGLMLRMEDSKVPESIMLHKIEVERGIG